MNKCGKSYNYVVIDDHKTALKFIYRVLNNGLNYTQYQHNLKAMHSISVRLKDISNWLNRPAGARYYPDSRKAYLLYNNPLQIENKTIEFI